MTKKTSAPAGDQIGRISMSLPQALLVDLDAMVAARGYVSRSQAIADMINHQLVESSRKQGTAVMAGTITAFYDRSVRGLQKRLDDLQYRQIDEVISSLHVHLTENKVMEVILVQGPAKKLQEIADEMATMKGVITCALQLMAAIIPPLHGSPTVGRPKRAT